MTSDQLKYFLVIEKRLNFSEAAAELNISQSSLSKHIQSLEQELGVHLFKRTTRKTSLTNAGIDFLPHAEQMLDLYNKMFVSMKDHSPKRKNQIDFSSVPGMSVYGITEMITAFNEANPQISINIIEADTLHIIQSLRDYKTDVAFSLVIDLPANEFKIFPVFRFDLALIVNKNHRFAARQSIKLSEAAGEDFLFLGVETGLYNICYDNCVKAGFEPKVTNTRQTHMQVGTLIDFVSKGLGISIINEKLAEFYLNSNYRIIKLEDNLTTDLAFIVRNEPLTSSCKQLIDFGLTMLETTE